MNREYSEAVAVMNEVRKHSLLKLQEYVSSIPDAYKEQLTGVEVIVAYLEPVIHVMGIALATEQEVCAEHRSHLSKAEIKTLAEAKTTTLLEAIFAMLEDALRVNIAATHVDELAARRAEKGVH